MVKKFREKFRNLNYSESRSIHTEFARKEEIKSDFVLLLDLIKEFLLYFLFLIPNVFLWIFTILFNSKSDKRSDYLSKIFMEPFKILAKISDWFFQAKFTSSLILFLVICYILEFIFLVPNQNLFKSFMAHPQHIFNGNFYSLLTSIFLHADLFHLFSNSLALLIFGRIVERQFGPKILFLFISSGIISNLVSNLIVYFFQPISNFNYSLGASGAIAGLIMFAILLEPLAFTSVFVLPLPIFVIGWFLISLDVIGLTNPSRTNHLAHLTGYGALLILFFFLEVRHKKKIYFGLAVNLFMMLLVYLFVKIAGFSNVSSFLGF